MKSTLVKAWITQAGLEARVILIHGTHHCGYVGVPKGHVLFGLDYDAPANRSLPLDTPIGGRSIMTLLCLDPNNLTLAQLFDVHGSLTFAGPLGDYAHGDGLHWFGFDCAHCDDARLDPDTGDLANLWPGQHFWTADEVEAECESLAKQIVQHYPQ